MTNNVQHRIHCQKPNIELVTNDCLVFITALFAFSLSHFLLLNINCFNDRNIKMWINYYHSSKGVLIKTGYVAQSSSDVFEVGHTVIACLTVDTSKNVSERKSA